LAAIARRPNPARTLDPAASSDLLRDITKGYIRELLDVIAKDPETRRIYDQVRIEDVAFYSLLTSVTASRTETNTLRAKERFAVTDRLRGMADSDRDITKQLMDRGLAPFLVTVADRDMFATQLQEQMGSGADRGEDYEDREETGDPAAEGYDLRGEDTVYEDDNVPPIGNRERDDDSGE